MKKTIPLLASVAVELCLATPLVAATARTATENFVANKIATAISQIPPPDYSTSNAALVATIEATAPVPSNYAEATMPARLMMNLPEVSQYVEPVSVFNMYVFLFNNDVDMPGHPVVVFKNGKWLMNCNYGDIIGNYDDFEGTVEFELPDGHDAPFDRYSFSVVYSPVATINKVDRTALAIAGQIPTTVSNIVTKAYVENLGITSEETDPTVPQWAKAQTKPTYTASEVGAYSTTAIDAILQGYLPLDYFQDGQTIPMYWGDGTKLCDFGANWLGNLANTVSEKPDDADIPPAVSNIVTTALVRERLGVYLYVGADGGIYVHTNED